MKLTPISDAIARVFWFWRYQPDSPMLRENPVNRLMLTPKFTDEMLAVPGMGGDVVIGRAPEMVVSKRGVSSGGPLSSNLPRAVTVVATPAQRDAILRGEMEVPAGGIRLEPELQVCKNVECTMPFERNAKWCPYCKTEGMKPKRIRSRHKPLTVADIVEGGVYVPKKGNDKTPNYVVEGIEFFDSHPGQPFARWTRPELASGFTGGTCIIEPNFLALVARRVGA